MDLPAPARSDTHTDAHTDAHPGLTARPSFDTTGLLPTGHNRRRAYRMPVGLETRVLAERDASGTVAWKLHDDGEHRVLDTLSEDLSVGGLRFRAPNLISRGTHLTVSFQLNDTPIELNAQVAHAAADTFGAAIGTEFTNIDRSPVGAQVARYLFACERRRLPRVRVMYSLRCTTGKRSEDCRGTTEECSPTFINALLEKPIPPGRPVELTLALDALLQRFTGRSVSCAASGQLWRTGIELAEPTPPRWREVLVERRDGLR